jgi:hypothetical protein
LFKRYINRSITFHKRYRYIKSMYH